MTDPLSTLAGCLPHPDDHPEPSGVGVPTDALRALLAEPTGLDMIAKLSREHDQRNSCPGCEQSISTVAITKLAYTFEPCSCDVASYEHLTERVWHLDCLRTDQTPSRDEVSDRIAEALDAWAEMTDTEMATHLDDHGQPGFLADAVLALFGDPS